MIPHVLNYKGLVHMGSNNVDALIDRALSFHRDNKVDEADAVYDQVLVLDPGNPDALHLKGAVSIQRGNYRRAVELISQAILVRPSDAAFYSNLAAALNSLGLPERAQHYAEKALCLKMNNSESYVVLAKSLIGQGKIDEALSKLEIALKIQPSNSAAINEYIKVLTQKSRYSDLTNFLELQLEEGRGTDKILISLASAKKQLGRSAEALDHLDQCKNQDGHEWHVHNLKIKIDLDRLDEARVHGREILIIKDKVSGLITPDEDVALRCRSWPLSLRPFDTSSPHRNIVCFSLWGNDDKYTHTAVLNAKLVPAVYPGWKARFYVEASVPLEIIEALRNYGAQVIMMEEDSRTFLKLFWRFLAASDVNVDYFICRDCDSIVNYREKAAVDEWLLSGKPFHIMRDHPEHAELIMAGMWGGVGGLLPNLADQAVQYYETHETKWRWVDQDFLRDCVWPLIKNSSLSHDSQYLFGPNARPFPAGSELPNGDHVGGYMPATWSIRGKI